MLKELASSIDGHHEYVLTCESKAVCTLVPILLDLFLLTRHGPSCSKLTTSLVNDSLKFTSSDMQIC